LLRPPLLNRQQDSSGHVCIKTPEISRLLSARPLFRHSLLRLRSSLVDMELIDSHAHIDFPQLAEDRDAVLSRARAAGVTTLLAIGSGPGPEKLDAAIPFAEQHDWIYATVGTHPHEAKELTPAHLEQLAKLAQHPRVIAYGEIGLDYFY